MQPSLGRIVHVRKNGIIHPAIIVKVLPNNNDINLVVFNDSPISTYYLINVPHDLHNESEPAENHWIWPPIVKELSTKEKK